MSLTHKNQADHAGPFARSPAVVRGRREMRMGLSSIAAIPMSQPNFRSWRCADSQARDGDDPDDDPVREAANDVQDHERQGGHAQGDRQAADSGLVNSRSITMNWHHRSLAASGPKSAAA